ncbi:MAG: DNA internalization-related competence protein ComEC/Rec2 [Deltaproteobacteria bacterium]|nr:DNA internalization-related competence protein ComEC/Rec2 [Deltaproteobacteria bacterium]
MFFLEKIKEYYAKHPTLPSFVMLVFTSFALYFDHLGILVLGLAVHSICFLLMPDNVGRLKKWIPVILSMLSLAWFLFNIGEISPKDLRVLKTFKGRVVSLAPVAVEKNRFLIRLIDPSVSKVLVRLTILDDSCGLAQGDVIQFKSKIAPPRYYADPGVLNYRKFLWQKGVLATSFLPNCDQIQILEKAAPTFFQRFRQKIINTLSAENLVHRDIIASLLFGHNVIQAEKLDVIRKAGLSHLFVISGTHFAAICSVIYLLGYLFLSGYPQVFLKIPRQKLCSAITLIFIFLYLGVIETHPSVLRASTMVICFLLAVLLERKLLVWDVLILSATFNLIVDPLVIFNLSFQFSYMALVLIFLGSPALLKFSKFFSKVHWVFGRFIYFLAMIVWINLGLAPLTLFYFSSWSLIGLLHNIWAIPLFEFLIMPLVLLVYVSAVFISSALPFLLSVIDLLLSAMFNGIQFFPSFKLADHLVRPLLIQVIGFYFLILLMCLGRRRKIKFAALIVVLVVFCFTSWWHKFSFEYRVTQIDVGQGDASLVETQGMSILIDSGGHRFLDVGSFVLRPFLEYSWVKEIDLAIITHADIDHYGGFTHLAEQGYLKEVWIPEEKAESPLFLSLLDVFEKNKVVLRKITRTVELKLNDHAVLSVFVLPDQSRKTLSKNDRSLVARVSFGEFCALFTGDLSKEGERLFVDNFKDQLRCDLLKVGHHGSVSSSTERFLRWVDPRYAFIGVGRRSQFGHPHKVVIDRLKNRDIQIFRTDQDGAVALEKNFLGTEIARHQKKSQFSLFELFVFFKSFKF